MDENQYDGKSLERRLRRLGKAASKKLLAREADDMSPNTLDAVFNNDPQVRLSTINRVRYALDRLEIKLAPRVKSRAG